MPSKYRRKSQLRDPYKRIIIASEGNVTEPDYFEVLRNNCRIENVTIVILKRNPDNTNSAPVHVLGELDAYKKAYGMKNMDELWLVIDKDRWPEKQVNQVLSDCSARHYHAALSNPCFEIWLILHHKDLTQLPEMELTHYSQRDVCKAKVGAMKKNRNNSQFYADLIKDIKQAVENAAKLDADNAGRYPPSIGTHVYKLAQSMTQNM